MGNFFLGFCNLYLYFIYYYYFFNMALLLGLLGLIVRLGLVMIQLHVDEDVGDVLLHSRCQPPVLLSQLGVVCYGVLHLLLLRAKGGDLAHEVGDAPHDRVLIVEACGC